MIIFIIFAKILIQIIMNDLSHYPINMVDSKYEINPKGIIQLSLSRLRTSEYSDNELAEYIADFLGMVMSKNNLTIDTEPECFIKLRFIHKNP
jgi:hypothetical protein